MYKVFGISLIIYVFFSQDVLVNSQWHQRTWLLSYSWEKVSWHWGLETNWILDKRFLYIAILSRNSEVLWILYHMAGCMLIQKKQVPNKKSVQFFIDAAHKSIYTQWLTASSVGIIELELGIFGSPENHCCYWNHNSELRKYF